MKHLIAAAALALVAGPLAAAPLCDNLGFAGLLAKCNREELPRVTLSAGQPLSEGPMALKSGVYYTMYIEADGSQELALVGPEFFRAIWINEVVINDLEIRPMALDSFEFDDEGTIRFTFIAIKPGRYELKIPGSTGDSQRVEISIQ
ncbi:hypothetical protein [Marinibacterium sp. SX1]|uniref:hypothetical protein n=1 Tax=Marinibacterium sp. SX1 TaxID=3388424 RepID=UPI003D17C4A4